MIVVGVDTGGTFTDFVFKTEDQWSVYKLLSTPDNPARAVLEGLDHVAKQGKKRIIHGSTVATNAILERKGARTALITNKGFEDVIEIGRQNRSRLYDLAYRKEPQIVPPDLRFGIKGRVLNTGEEYEPLDEKGARKVIRQIGQSQAQSVAVCFIFSFANPSHEKEIKELLGNTGIAVSLSHEILAEFREFERISTTLLNAYVVPKMHTYIGHLIAEMAEESSLSIMQSNGGSISAETAMEESVRTILSGPAGGVVGALEIGKIAGHTHLITFDMGGTMELQRNRLDSFFGQMAKGIGLSPMELAEGILSVANTAMEKAIRVISVEKGYDPREFVLFSFGGAGGMHGAFLARLLNIPKVLVPQNPGIMSAIGMIMADVIKDYSFTVMRNQLNCTAGHLAKLFQNLEKRGFKDLSKEGIGKENVRLERYLDMRYEGQSYEIIVPFDVNYIDGFHTLHEKTYGYRNEDKIVEIVNIRLRARGIPDKPRFQRAKKVKGHPPQKAFLGEREVVFDQRVRKTQILHRENLLSGNRIPGPAILVEYSSTIVIPPFAEAHVDEYGNVIMEIVD
ncbi:MAG: hydantoinase/oxoprolinase family protein [Deltaproteobacteria bacterium]